MQPLCAAYSVPALRAAIAAAGAVHGAPLSTILGHLELRTLADQGAARDIDTPEELAMAETRVTLDEWVRLLAAELDVDPADVDVTEILDVARVAAHGIARPAAPLTTWLAGYAAGLRGGGTLHAADALRSARSLAEAAREPGGLKLRASGSARRRRRTRDAGRRGTAPRRRTRSRPRRPRTSAW